jgi:hypothetical protein
VNHADASTGQHGDDLFGNFGQVDRHAIACVEAKLLQCVGAAIDLAVELRVCEDPLLIVFTHPNERRFILARGGDVPVETIVSDIAGRADEPFRPGIIPFQDFVPWRKPVQFLRHPAPERFGIGDRFLVFGFVVLDVGISRRSRRGPVEAAFF